MIKCPACQHSFSAKEAKMRSLPQQKYYFGVIVKTLSDELGYSTDETHEILKTLFLSEIKFIKTKNGVKEARVTRSTTEITTAEAEEFYSQIRIWSSSELGIWLPEPNEELIEKTN